MRNDYTNYLMHRDHKYIDRKWVRGKWHYIYDEKLGGKEKKATEQTQSNTMSSTINTRKDPTSDYGKTTLAKCEALIARGKELFDSLFGNNTDNSNRPRARKKNETPNGSGLAKRGSANTGKPVGEGGNVNERFYIRRR